MAPDESCGKYKMIKNKHIKKQQCEIDKLKQIINELECSFYGKFKLKNHIIIIDANVLSISVNIEVHVSIKHP